MRLLLVADLHYVLPQLDWVVDVAPEFDAVVVAGDLLDVSSPVPLEMQSAVVLEYLNRLHASTVLVTSSGNHDLTGPDAAGEQSALWLSAAANHGLLVDGAAVTIGDILVTVCPWWDGPVGRTAVTDQLARDAADRPARWIWVYHWPPDGSPTCWTGNRHYGDPDLVGWIDEHRPDIVLTGHVHQPPFKPEGAWADRIGTTWVFNSGRQIGPVPAHTVIDLDQGTATWTSMMGTETLDLTADSPPARTVF